MLPLQEESSSGLSNQPASVAISTAWVRDDAPIRVEIAETWLSTVRRENAGVLLILTPILVPAILIVVLGDI